MKQGIRRHIGGTQRLEIPEKLYATFKKAKKLEWLTLGYLISVGIVMFLAMGSSAAMKAAWVEDIVSVFPALAFLLASRICERKSTPDYPYGYHKAFTVAFIAGSLSLLILGLYVLSDSALSLIRMEHPTIGTFSLFGSEIWMGWAMIAALLYSFIPAIILGRVKLPLASEMHEKVLRVDAEAQKADWMTAGAAIVGIIGIGFGLWWADAVAAIGISLSIVYDGVCRTRDGMKDLMEELPKTYNNKEVHPLVGKTVELCLSQDWVKDVRVRMREHGMVFFGDVLVIVNSEEGLIDNIDQLGTKIEQLDWKLKDMIVSPVKRFKNESDHSDL